MVKIIRKHKGINQKTGRLNKGYKYSGACSKTGLKQIVKKPVKKPVKKMKGGAKSTKDSRIKKDLTKLVKERGVAKMIMEMRGKDYPTFFLQVFLKSTDHFVDFRISKDLDFDPNVQEIYGTYELKLDGTSRIKQGSDGVSISKKFKSKGFRRGSRPTGDFIYKVPLKSVVRGSTDNIVYTFYSGTPENKAIIEDELHAMRHGTMLNKFLDSTGITGKVVKLYYDGTKSTSHDEHFFTKRAWREVQPWMILGGSHH